MKRKLITVLLLMMLISNIGYANENEVPIRVLMDGAYLVMEVSPIMIDSRTMVPLKDIFEALGATVIWDQNNRTAIGSRCDDEIHLPIDRPYAFINGDRIPLDAPATIRDNRTLVPLRFVSEALGATVDWEGKTRTVTIDTGSSTTECLELESGLINRTLGVEIPMGMSEEEVIALLGEPNRKDVSEKGFYWYVYNEDYENYIQIGVEGGRVIALGTNAEAWATMEGLDMKKNFSDIQSIYGRVRRDSSSKDMGVVNLETITIEIYFDSHENNHVMAYKIYAKRIAQRRHNITDDVLRGMELRNLDFTNVTRGLKGLSYLDWCDGAENIARDHSLDMAENGYFAHNGPNGLEPWDRLKNGGINYNRAAENIAAGYNHALDVHVAWMNSEGHRRNILDPSLTRLGVGIINEANVNGATISNKLFFTQKFYAPNR